MDRRNDKRIIFKYKKNLKVRRGISLMSELEDTGILEELLEENRIMKEHLREIIEETSVESLSGIVFAELEKGIKISGILLAEGYHNGIYYSPKEIKNMVENYKDDIIGMEITVEHENTSKYRDRQVGKITKVEYDPILKAAKYEAIITDEEAIQ